LFGVGGETIMVGLLAAIAQTIYGNVDYAKGIPWGRSRPASERVLELSFATV
jgi:hypothetical protein